jgi:hypothetical protein
MHTPATLSHQPPESVRSRRANSLEIDKKITSVVKVQEPVDPGEDNIPWPQRQATWHQPGLFDTITKRFMPVAPKVDKKPPLELVMVSRSVAQSCSTLVCTRTGSASAARRHITDGGSVPHTHKILLGQCHIQLRRRARVVFVCAHLRCTQSSNDCVQTKANGQLDVDGGR